MSHSASAEVLLLDLAVTAAVVGVQRIQASRRFRQQMLSLLDDLAREGATIEEAALTDADVLLIGSEGDPLPMKQLADGQLVCLGTHAEPRMHALRQRYAYLRAQRDLEADGFNLVDQVVETNGDIKLLARRWGTRLEEVEAHIRAEGTVRYQGFGMPPETCGSTVERLAQRMGRITEQQVHAHAVEPVLRLFQTAR